MEHVRKHRSSKENPGKVESRGKRTFEDFEAKNIGKLPYFLSVGDDHSAGLAGITSISRGCDVCRERPSRELVLLYPFPRRTGFCGTCLRGQFLRMHLNTAR